jgi:lysophospholipid acyltransferase (LPLAT)-like uncharacterized protein
LPSRSTWWASIQGEVLYQGTRLLIGATELHAVNSRVVLRYKAEGRRVVLVCWHGHDFVNLGIYGPVFSPYADGTIMLRDNPAGLVLAHFGHRMRLRVISLGHDAASARWSRGVVDMIKAVKQGHDGLLAVDGPEGPPHVVKPGAAYIAQHADAVVFPAAAASNRAIRLRNRWDNHLIPLPGSRTVIHFGPPIDTRPTNGGVAPSVEELSARIDAALCQGTRIAQQLAHAPGPRGGAR